MEENFFTDPEAVVPAEDDAESDDALLDVARELHLWLQGFNARLVHNEGAVAIEVAGAVEVGGRRYPYRLVPERCVLARVQKWRKLPEEKHLALVRERLHMASVAEFEADVRAFVTGVLKRAQAEGLDGARFLSALETGKELASRRFRIVDDRLAEAAARRRAETLAEAARDTVKLTRYPESFETAFMMRRRFVAILGPTNSGKTHQAMEALAQAATGVYLAPLRLLALENYERLADRGVAVSLVTGEERRITPGATHVASTIEMLDTSRPVEVAVIDEIQMLEDLDRGSAWTAAVCGAAAKTVFLLGALSARPAVEALAERLGCELEVRTLERKSPLEMAPRAVGNIGQLRRGDAVIAFSRRDVLNWATNIAEAGFRVATIYGNLSPEVRRAQAQRFRDGEADIVVATDAIGMGLNLPVARVVFSTAKKFDGISEDILAPWLTHQIAGRAGRFGLHEAGLVAGFDDHTHSIVGRLMRTAAEPLSSRGFYVTPSLHHLKSISAATGERSLARLLELFSRNIDLTDDFFLPGDMTEQIERARWLDALPLSLEHRFTLSLVPVSTRVESLNQAWQEWARALSKERTSHLSIEPVGTGRYALQAAEDACKKYSAYAWLGYRLPDHYPDAEVAVSLARSMSETVDEMLARQHGRRDSGSRGRGRGRGKPGCNGAAQRQSAGRRSSR
ncbi:helicase-related protein [Aromatoleum toluolicum]|uniref:RNA helicase n=1 Tax=Aromatoleum toluolicum TaxID=90060 RepID=A0ABX1NEB8_9RHOO|nr:helicase-related protein [Aromatoleum toluolicum]NMF97638.1 helicase-related protein [Aromatoleum toluolicum]